jgi:beta-glucosidase
MEWEVFPQGLSDLLIRLQREYRPPAIYITENGAAYGDGPDAEGRIADTRRVAYLSGHLAAARRAIEAGVPLRGYFAWSLLDNFEWTGGYAKRFGLYWVDYASQQRLPKDSAFWYRDVVAGNGEMENTV